MFSALVINVILAFSPFAPTLDDTLEVSSIVASMKQVVPIERLAAPVSTFYSAVLERDGIKNPKNLSAEIPNLYMPDYGSSMTSSIYLRGFGSRIDNPVISLYVDDFPILDKNSYDIEMMDLRKLELIRGPQGTLYGRNAMCGVLAISSLSPNVYQGIRASAEIGSFGTYSARASIYKGNHGFSLSYRHSDGYYKNSYDNSSCDGLDAITFRHRYHKSLRSGIELDNSFQASALNQSGYPYRQLLDGELLPINYNDYSGYKRISILEGLKLSMEKDDYKAHSATSIQVLMDRMDMDQDFTERSMFTLSQMQRQAALTQEFVLRKTEGQSKHSAISGVAGFIRYNNMSSPVTFLRDGIQELILDNANSHIPDFIGKLSFKEDEFVISSDFNILTYNAAAYHESYFRLGKWLLTAGIRLDFEGNSMGYDSRSMVHFIMSPSMKDYHPCETSYTGNINNTYLQILPKLSALYDLGDVKLFSNISKGYKSGGFNTQIFSDILQNEMMNELMELVGVHLENENKSIGAENTSYKPEESWNLELGFKSDFQLAEEHNFSINASAFRVECRHQQITVFPPGQSTGRMMANVGRSRSSGLEADLKYSFRSLTLSAAYGFTDARFLNYNDGLQDYTGNFIPYSPRQTLSAKASYRHLFERLRSVQSLTATLSYNGVGRIYWDEANTLCEPSGGSVGVSLSLDMNKYSLFVRGDNILGNERAVFYFKSVGREFMQMNRPGSISCGITVEL